MEKDFLVIIGELLSNEECKDKVSLFLSNYISNDTSLINYNDFLKKIFNII